MEVFKKQRDLLVKSAELGKLPHALLFYGEEGIGKKGFTINLAKHLVGDNIGGGINPDFILLEAEKKNIQIKQIRELLEKLSFKPYSSEFKIGVVNDAHLMNKEAQNCFLKFLEEPTTNTHLILITAFPSLLLPTILSRLQKVRFYSGKEIKREYDKALTDDLARLVKSDLAFRFQYAKSKEKDNLEELFNSWTGYLRKALLQRMKGKESEEFTQYSQGKLKDVIEAIQKTKALISSTNINQKLALEILLISL